MPFKKANKLIEEVCEELNLKYLEAFKYKDPVWEVEDKINAADLVIGLGRSAFEAFACGRPVIVFDDRSYFKSCGDGYIKDTLIYSIKNNCSGRYFKMGFDKSKLIGEIKKYNPEDSAYFRDFAKKELDVELNVDKYLDYYYNLKGSKKNAYFFFKKINRLLIKIVKK